MTFGETVNLAAVRCDVLMDFQCDGYFEQGALAEVVR